MRLGGLGKCGSFSGKEKNGSFASLSEKVRGLIQFKAIYLQGAEILFVFELSYCKDFYTKVNHKFNRISAFRSLTRIK